VAEDGATQMVNCCALLQACAASLPELHCRKQGTAGGRLGGRLKATCRYRATHAIGKRGMISN